MNRRSGSDRKLVPVGKYRFSGLQFDNAMTTIGGKLPLATPATIGSVQLIDFARSGFSVCCLSSYFPNPEFKPIHEKQK